MEKYNSIPEMEQAQAEQKWKYNKACVEAMTDEELVHLKSLIDEECSQRFKQPNNSGLVILNMNDSSPE